MNDGAVTLTSGAAPRRGRGRVKKNLTVAELILDMIRKVV